MGATTISWCDHSINPIRARHKTTGRTGHYCEKLSAGCQNCYSSRLQARFGMPEFRAKHAGDVEPFLDTTRFLEVLRRKKPTKYFWCDMTDMFGEWVPDSWVDQCFAVMALTPQHVHMVLTKRAERMWRYFSHEERPALIGMANHGEASPEWMYNHWPLPNVWPGVSCENQPTADERISWLMKTPAVVRFLSCEPLLGPIELTGGPLPIYKHHGPPCGVVQPDFHRTQHAANIHWLICGGESGPHARPLNLAWLRNIVEQCQAAGVACWVKQVGSNPQCPSVEGWPEETQWRDGVALHGTVPLLNDRKGANSSEWPEWARVQQFPGAVKKALL